jgi:phosphate transport system substrate-binding protein
VKTLWLCLSVSVLALFLSLNAFSQTSLTGAGSTFVNPMMSKWASEYHKLHPDIEINYQSVGSGAGIRQVLEGTVDFGATDGPMTDEQLASSKAGKILHIPLVMGADVPAYNIPGVSQELRFTPELLAGIFLGKITSWNDPQITKENPGVSLPNQPILVVHRSDGSGTTYIWTDYLSKVSKEWQSSVGRGGAVKWPVGLGGKGNEGVSGMIRQLPGSIGYVELIYAQQNKIPYGPVRNAAGNFIAASVESVTAAAAATQIPADYRYSITNTSGKDAYPISGTTWALLPDHARDANKGKILVDFIQWVITDGQGMATVLHYSKLPSDLVPRLQATLKTVK